MSSVKESRNWENREKQQFVRDCQKLVKDGLITNSGTEKSLRYVLTNFILNVCHGICKIDNAIEILDDVSTMHQDIPSLLIDIFSIIDVMTLSQASKSDHRNNFLKLLSHSYSIIPEFVMKERLDFDTLADLKIIDSKDKFNKNLIKMKTKMFYKQLKFNLLREESEGFSKLMTELHQDFSAPNAPSVQDMIKVTQSLIGFFNIDPNRVLDIILEMFEMQLQNQKFFCELLSEYSKDQFSLADLIGFKFKFYVTENQQTPASLYKLAAILILHDLLPCHAIYQQLGPSDEDINEKNKKELADVKSYVKKNNTISLADVDNSNDVKDDDINLTSIVMDNQKVGLIQALLEIGDWYNAKLIIDRLPAYFATSNNEVAIALCKLCHDAIEPLYSKIERNVSSCIVTGRRIYSPNLSTIEPIRVTSVLEMREKLFPVLCYLGPHASTDPSLLFKLCRLCSCFLKQREKSLKEKGSPTDDHENIHRGILTIVDEVLLPSLSLMIANYPFSEEIWNVLKYYSYQHRYRMYGQWKNDSYLIHPKLIRAKAECLKKTKHSMRRLAKENVKIIGRQLGKLSHSNPAVIFDYILSQVQTFDNLIGPVADSFKYLSNLSSDLLAYSIIEALASPEKERMKYDDTNISSWLQCLANFSATIFKKYPIDLSGILQYVANQLKANKSLDLLVLREILQRMANVEVSEEVTDEQLECLYGGELLKSEGGNFITAKNIKRSCQRLRENLVENNLDVPLSLLMAQQRYCIVFTEKEHNEDTHVKLLGKVYDQCNDTFHQFTSFITTQLSLDELKQKLPSLDELLTTFCITADAAFALYRPYFSNAIITHFNDGKTFQLAIESVLKPLEISLTNFKLCNELTLQCYLLFWTLHKSDLSVPEMAYDRQFVQYKQQKQALESSSDTSSKRKRDIDRLTVTTDKLKEEEKHQLEHVQRVKEYLKLTKDTLFASKISKNATVSEFLQICIFPRACFSAVDALYCAEFVKNLHSMQTVNFSTLIFFDRVFSDITYCVTSRSENEAHRYGRFLCSLLEMVMFWHSSESNFNRDCSNTPGFVTNFRATSKTSNESTVKDHLDYQNYRHVVHKWHFSITRAMVACLESNNYTQIRNAVIVLIRILPYYPMVTKFGSALERRIDRMCVDEKDKRPDLHALGTGYSGQLKSKKKQWVNEEQFHAKENKASNTKMNSVKKDSKATSDAKVSGKKDNDLHAKKDVNQQESLSLKTDHKPSPKLDEKRIRTVKMNKSKDSDGLGMKTDNNLTSDNRKPVKLRKIDKPLKEGKDFQLETNGKGDKIDTVKKREEFIEKVRTEKDLLREKERLKTAISSLNAEASLKEIVPSKLKMKDSSDRQIRGNSPDSIRSESSEKDRRRKNTDNNDEQRPPLSVVQRKSANDQTSNHNQDGTSEVKRITDSKRRKVESSPRDSPQYHDEQRRVSRNDRTISPPIKRISPNDEYREKDSKRGKGSRHSTPTSSATFHSPPRPERIVRNEDRIEKKSLDREISRKRDGLSSFSTLEAKRRKANNEFDEPSINHESRRRHVLNVKDKITFDDGNHGNLIEEELSTKREKKVKKTKK